MGGTLSSSPRTRLPDDRYTAFLIMPSARSSASTPAHTPTRTSGAHVSRSDVPGYEELGPCPRHRIATRARICSTGFYTWRARGQRKDRQALGRVVPLAAAPSRRVGSKSTHRYLSFDPVTEHIASEMRLILRSDKGKAGVLYRACLDLPSAACPPSRPSAHSRMAWPGLASTEADPEARRGPVFMLSGWPDTPPILPTSAG